MATVAPTITQLGPKDGSVIKVKWVLTGIDDGAPVEFAQWADRSVQIGSTGDAFGAGGTVIWEGQNDEGALWFTLTDAQTTAVTKTTSALEQVVEISALARPRASVAVTSVTITAVLRRQPRS